jgi:hypothetical protein
LVNRLHLLCATSILIHHSRALTRNRSTLGGNAFLRLNASLISLLISLRALLLNQQTLPVNLLLDLIILRTDLELFFLKQD